MLWIMSVLVISYKTKMRVVIPPADFLKLYEIINFNVIRNVIRDSSEILPDMGHYV